MFWCILLTTMLGDLMIDRSLRWVAPNGVWLIADEFPSERRSAAVHVVQRPLSEYVPILAENGFAFDQSWRRFHAARHSGNLVRE